MMRESLAADSPHAFMAITAGSGSAFQRRPTAGGLSLHTAGPAVTAPRWVKLVRVGNRLTGSISNDGVTWTEAGADTVAMPAAIFAGLAVTAHNNGMLGTAAFTDVEVVTAPVLRFLERLGNGQVRVQVIGQAGVSYCIESSPSLAEWTLAGCLTATNVMSEFLDTQPAAANQGFYRGFIAR
jgi:hypothetical protein